MPSRWILYWLRHYLVGLSGEKRIRLFSSFPFVKWGSSMCFSTTFTPLVITTVCQGIAVGSVSTLWTLVRS